MAVRTYLILDHFEPDTNALAFDDPISRYRKDGVDGLVKQSVKKCWESRT